jgi:hypothetical protein
LLRSAITQQFVTRKPVFSRKLAVNHDIYAASGSLDSSVDCEYIDWWASWLAGNGLERDDDNSTAF